jgi:hypothetical protein
LKDASNGKEPRQRAAVVGHEERRLRGLKGVDHRLTFSHRPRHRLFDVTGLFGARAAQREVGVALRRRRDVDRVDIRIGDERVNIVVPTANPVARRVIARESWAPTHDRHEP